MSKSLPGHGGGVTDVRLTSVAQRALRLTKRDIEEMHQILLRYVCVCLFVGIYVFLNGCECVWELLCTYACLHVYIYISICYFKIILPLIISQFISDFQCIFRLWIFFSARLLSLFLSLFFLIFFLTFYTYLFSSQ